MPDELSNDPQELAASSPCLILYGHPYCSSAMALRRAFETDGIPFEWRDVREGAPEYRLELQRLAHGNLSVPTVVFPDGTVMVEPSLRQVLKRVHAGSPGLLERFARLLGRGT